MNASNGLQQLLAQLQQWGNQSSGGVKWNQYMPQDGGGGGAQGDTQPQAQPTGAWAKMAMLLAPQTAGQAMQGRGLFGGMGGSGKGGATATKGAPPSYEPDHSEDY